MRFTHVRLSLALVLSSLISVTAFATNAPTNFTVTPTSNSALALSWTPVSGDPNITGYTYAIANNSSFTGATYTWVGGGSGSSSATKTGLSTASTYWLKIKSEGTVDSLDSAFGPVVIATTMPASLSGSAASSSQINLTWTGNSANTNISGYTVATATSSSFASATYNYVSGAGATSLSKTGLFAGTTYYFKVKAEGSSDTYDSPFTAYITVATSSAAPNAPSSLSATVMSSSQIDLAWTDNSSNETGFEVKRATDSAFTQNVVWIGNISGNTYSNTGLSPSTTYYYKVRAEGTSAKSSYSNVVSATTNSSGTIPTAPSNLNATATSTTSVNLTWTDNSSNETGFELKRATDSAFTQNVVWMGNLQGSSYTNSGLSPSTTYYYKVRAEGTAGKSAYSSSASVTTGGSTVTGGTPIFPTLFGINAWMPYQIGEVVKNGKLEQVWPKVQESNAKSMRYGGHGVDTDANPQWIEQCSGANCTQPSDPCEAGTLESTMNQYLAMVQSMRDIGVEPILQVPVDGPNGYTASQAADIVRCVNVTKGKAVKYWSIGNEPDLTGSSYQPVSAASVSQYLKDFSRAMKAVDSSIKIMGPETAWYNTSIIDALTTAGGQYDVTGTDPTTGRYYVDVISFHAYPFNGANLDPTVSTNRDLVIDKLMASGNFNDNLAALALRVGNCNSSHSRSGSNAVEIAVTEANINYNQRSDDTLTGYGAKSFIGGQFWVEMLGIAMKHSVKFLNFWSVVEGNGLSYLSSDGLTRRPTFHHFKMMSDHFRGNAVTATDNQIRGKAFAAKDVDQIAVVIMNQEASTNMTYTVRLNNDTISTNTFRVNVDAGVAQQATGTIDAQSTIVLVFDSSGTLKKKVEYKLNDSAPVVTTY